MRDDGVQPLALHIGAQSFATFEQLPGRDVLRSRDIALRMLPGGTDVDDLGPPLLLQLCHLPGRQRQFFVFVDEQFAQVLAVDAPARDTGEPCFLPCLEPPVDQRDVGKAQGLELCGGQRGTTSFAGIQEDGRLTVRDDHRGAGLDEATRQGGRMGDMAVGVLPALTHIEQRKGAAVEGPAYALRFGKRNRVHVCLQS